MDLEQFAKTAGVEIVDCGDGWGGRIGYRTKDYPNCTTCGFRTRNAALKGWLGDTFGPTTAKAVAKLLAPTARATSTTQPADGAAVER